MKRTSFADQPCPLARSLDLVGEWWTLLILREVFMGVRRFGDFERRLGIAKNVLSTRLRRLVEGGVLERRAARDDAREVEYRLTDKGRELFPVLLTLAQWGARWTGADSAALRFVNRSTGAALAPLAVRDVDGVALAARDIAVECPAMECPDHAAPGNDDPPTTAIRDADPGASASPVGRRAVRTDPDQENPR